MISGVKERRGKPRALRITRLGEEGNYHGCQDRAKDLAYLHPSKASMPRKTWRAADKGARRRRDLSYLSSEFRILR